jgi:hypothetical protein
MAILGIITKQPREILDFDVDYTDVLANRSGDQVSSVVTEVSPSGALTVSGTTVFPSTNKVKVFINAGTDGVTYKVTVMTTTTAGLMYEDEVTVVVGDT